MALEGHRRPEIPPSKPSAISSRRGAQSRWSPRFSLLAMRTSVVPRVDDGLLSKSPCHRARSYRLLLRIHWRHPLWFGPTSRLHAIQRHGAVIYRAPVRPLDNRIGVAAFRARNHVTGTGRRPCHPGSHGQQLRAQYHRDL